MQLSRALELLPGVWCSMLCCWDSRFVETTMWPVGLEFNERKEKGTDHGGPSSSACSSTRLQIIHTHIHTNAPIWLFHVYVLNDFRGEIFFFFVFVFFVVPSRMEFIRVDVGTEIKVWPANLEAHGCYEISTKWCGASKWNSQEHFWTEFAKRLIRLCWTVIFFVRWPYSAAGKIMLF